jgi:hypothetical protein
VVVRAENPGISRFRAMFEPLLFVELARRHPDLYPPLARASPAEIPRPDRRPPPTETAGQIEWLGRWGDAAAVPDLADRLMASLDDAHSADWYDGHLIPEIARSGPQHGLVVAALFRRTASLPRPKRAASWGTGLKRLRERSAQKPTAGPALNGQPGGRSERRSSPQLNGY